MLKRGMDLVTAAALIVLVLPLLLLCAVLVRWNLGASCGPVLREDQAPWLRTTKAVKSLLSRARENLRIALKPYLEMDGAAAEQTSET